MTRRWTLFAGALVLTGAALVSAQGAQKARCPLKGVEFDVKPNSPSINVNGKPVHFCCAGCPRDFVQAPERYLTQANYATNCVVQRQRPARVDANFRAVVNNELFYFCCGGCPNRFVQAVHTFVTEVTDPVSGKRFKPTADSPRSTVGTSGRILFLFENAQNKATFDQDPGKYSRFK